MAPATIEDPHPKIDRTSTDELGRLVQKEPLSPMPPPLALLHGYTRVASPPMLLPFNMSEMPIPRDAPPASDATIF